MAEEFIPEGFELVNKEDKKEKEIIPGFEVVEKQEVVAEDAAPAAAGESSSTDSILDNGLLEQEEVEEIEGGDEITQKELLERSNITSRRANRDLDKLYRKVKNNLPQDYVFNTDNEAFNIAAKDILDNYYSKPETRRQDILTKDVLKREIQNLINQQQGEAVGFYDDYAPVTEDELPINEDIIPENGKVVGIRAIMEEGELESIPVPQDPGMSPIYTGEVVKDGTDGVLQQPKLEKTPQLLSGKSMLKIEVTDPNTGDISYQYVPYVASEEKAEDVGELQEMSVTTYEDFTPEEYVSDYTYTLKEKGYIDKVFNPEPGVMRKDEGNNTYSIDYDAGFDSALNNLKDEDITEENFKAEYTESDQAFTRKDKKTGEEIRITYNTPGARFRTKADTGFNGSTFTSFGFIYDEKEGVIKAANGKTIQISKGGAAVKQFLRDNKSEFNEDYHIDSRYNIANEKLADTNKKLSYLRTESTDLINKLKSEETNNKIDWWRDRVAQADSSINSLNKLSESLDSKKKELDELKAKATQGLVSKNKYNRNVKRYNKDLNDYKKVAQEYNTLKLSDWEVVSEKIVSPEGLEDLNQITLKSPSGEKITVHEMDFQGDWKNMTLKEYTDRYDKFQKDEVRNQLELFKKLNYLDRLLVHETTGLNKVSEILQEKYELEVKRNEGLSGFDAASPESYLNVGKEVLNDFGTNLAKLVYEYPIVALGRTNQFVGNLFGMYDDYDNKQIDNSINQIRRDVNYITEKYFNVNTDKRFSRQWNESFAGQAQQVMVDMVFDVMVTKGMGGSGAIRAARTTFQTFKKAPTVTAAAKLVAKSAGKTATSPMYARIYTQIDEELSKDEFKDMDPRSKFLYSTGMGYVIGQLEKLGIDATVGKAGPQVVRYIIGKAASSGKKNMSKVVDNTIADLVRKGALITGSASAGMAGEVITENIQELVEIGGQDLVNYLNGFTGKTGETGFINADWGSKEMFEQIKEVTLLTMAASGPIATVSSAVQITQEEGNTKWMNDLSDTQFAANYQMFSTDEGLQNEIARIELDLKKGKIPTREEADKKLETIKKIHGIMSKIPSNLSTRQQQIAHSNLEEIQELEEQIEGRDPDLVEDKIQRVKELKQENKDLATKGREQKQEVLQNIQALNPDANINAVDVSNEQSVNDALVNVPENKKAKIKEELNNGAAIFEDSNGNTQIIVDENADLDKLLTHEDRHAFLSNVLQNNPELAFRLSNLIKDKLEKTKGSESAIKLIEEKEKLYREDADYDAAMLAEEMIMFFGDALTDQNVVTGLGKDNLFTKIKDGLRRLYSDTFKKEVTLRNEKDLINLIKDHRRAVETGKESERLKRFREGNVKLKGKLASDEDVSTAEIEQRKKEQELIRQETDQDVSDADIRQSKDMKETLDNIVQDENQKARFKNKQEFQADMAAFEAYEAIQNTRLLDGEILRRINRDSSLSGLDDNVKRDIVRKVKENVSERVLKNFDPAKNESLFGYITGNNGQIDFALLDTKKQYATTVSGRSIDQPTAEGQTFDIADTSTNIIENVDRDITEAPRSTFRKNIVRGREKGLTPQEVKSFKEAAEPLVKKLPDVDAKDYRTKVNQVAGPGLKKWVNENIFKGNWGRQFILDNYNNIRDLGVDYLIDLDKGLQRQGKPRIFTEFNKKLTTQAEIRKYRDSGRAFVENEAQGVSLFDIKNPGPEAMADFFLNDTASNNSNRKGKLMEAYGKKMFKDLLPEVRAKRGESDRVRATSARKTQKDPRLLFAKRNVDALLIVLGQTPLNARNSNGQIVSQDDIELFKEFLIDEWPKYLPITLLNPSTLANGGRGKFPSQFLSSEELSEVKAKARVNQSFDLTQRERDALNEVKKSVSTWWSKIQDTGKRVFQNDKWKEANKLKQEGIEVLWKQFEAMYKANPENAKFIAAYIQTSSSNSSHIMRMAGYPIGYQENWKSNKGPEREHVIPANEVGEFLFKVVADPSLKDISISDVMPYINDNYFQILINKYYDHKLKGAGLQSKMPDGFFESIIEAVRANDPSLAKEVWVRYFDPKVNEAISPDGVSGFDPNRIIINKNGKTQTVSEYFGLDVDKKLINPEVISIQQDLIYQIANNDITKAEAKKQFYYQVIKEVDGTTLSSNIQEASNSNKSITEESKVVLFQSKQVDMNAVLSKAATLDDALRKANLLDQPIKKIRVFDFDDTLAQTNSIVFYTKQDGTRGQLTAEEFAEKGGDLVAEGAVMDFSDFNIVRDGRRGPLFEVAKKIKAARGNEDLFVLTARAPESQDAIYEFLKAEGLEFKRENIIGLGNSTGEAKANWIVDKAAEGYNDFYFADDAYQNVKAVQDALSVIDVKSKIQQAKIKQSKDLSIAYNKLLQETTGIEYYKEYSPAKAKTIGASKGRFKFFIPHSAEDFLGLIYPTLGKGKLGDRQMAWYKKHLLDPYTKAQENMSAARLNLMNDFKQLKKSLDVPKDLRKKNSTGMTNEQAVRVYLFQSMGYEIPGLSKTDLKELQSVVENNPKLKVFAEQILSITKGDGYSKPRPEWLTGTITTDLIDLINTEKRSKYLAEWQQNVDAIYSKENLNKLEAIYGSKYREALEGILKRMKSGRNRLDTGNRLSNKVLDYINGSIGTIMFFNTRSAVLQTISSINFINWNFNNPIRAGAAFANQKQYWSDFVKLMNSDYLKDRRNGLKLNISESEIADAASTSKNKAKAVINYILQKGYLPTQYADSFAIASGGATFYRNRIKDLMKNSGMTEADAEAQAMVEWRQVAEESQQSSDPSRISAQQSSDLGRIILAFANTPMQYARIQKRAIQDLINGRGDAKTHVSKIIYYGFIQNVIFNALQQAVFALGFGDDDEEEDESKQKKYLNTANGMLDSLLRGLGIAGQAVSVGKNFLMDIYERSGRKRPEYVDAVWKLTQFSPPINSKISKLKQAAWHFDSKKRRQVIFDKGFALDNPAYEAFAKVVSATVNVPIDRLFYKMKNIEGALNEDNDLWQRVAMLAGWPEWQLKDKAKEPELTPEQKEKAKASKAVENYKAAKGSTDYDTLKKLTAAQQIKMLRSLGYGEYTIKNAKSEKAKIDLIIHKNSSGKIKVDKKAEDTAKYKALNKAEQVAKLDSLGLSDAEIKALKYEKDRVNKLLELMK